VQELSQAMQKVGATVYGQPGGQPPGGQPPGGQQGPGGEEGPVEGEFREV